MTKEALPAVEVSTQPQPNFAGLLVRYAAFILDGFVLAVLYLLVGFIAIFLSGQRFSIRSVEELKSPLNLIFLSIFWCYNVIFITKNGATPGKRFFKVKVVRTDHTPVSLGRAALRETVGKLLSGLVFSLGYFWAAFDSKKQSWHDKIARTYVIYTEILSTGRKATAYIVALLLPGLAVLGIAASMLLVAVNPARQIDQARDAVRKSDIINLQQAIGLYYTEGSVYPSNLSELTGWISVVPKDPETKKDYVYQITERGKDYVLRATLSTGEVYEVRGKNEIPLPSPEFR